MKAKRIRKIIVCTTISHTDNDLVELLEKENIEYFRGSEKDILQRFYDAAKFFKSDVIIDVEGDKIYTEPYFIDKIVEDFQKTKTDFVIGSDYNGIFDPGNNLVNGFIPAGIRFSALERICRLKKTENTETGYKEFFTLSNLFNVNYIRFDTKTDLNDRVRLTIDYNSDYILAKEIFKELGMNFNYKDVLRLFTKNPELIKMASESIKEWGKNYKKEITDFTLKEDL